MWHKLTLVQAGRALAEAGPVGARVVTVPEPCPVRLDEVWEYPDGYRLGLVVPDAGPCDWWLYVP